MSLPHAELQPQPEIVAAPSSPVNRRDFLRTAAAGAASLTGIAAAAPRGAAAQQASGAAVGSAVELPQLHAPTETPEKIPGPFDGPDHRIGFAVVGLGRLAVGEILPAFGKSKHCRVTALVSGDRGKAQKLAAQYGVADESIYDYSGFDRLAQNPAVQVIYIVLPNSMHREFVERGAKTGKHILCEKPMATSARDCERMIAACKAVNVKLMIAYRQQYEPNNRAIAKMIKEGKLGTVKSFVATNAQNQGDPAQWRQKAQLAGGGALPDVGIYCLNAARFLTGEEPIEVWGSVVQPKEDPRFREVEETCSFSLRFPSGTLATCSTGYGVHVSQFLRVEGTLAFAEMNPAFGYHGLRTEISRVEDGRGVKCQLTIEDKDQFALEMDHMAECVRFDRQPHTSGAEGLQDQRLVEAIYESARTGRAVTVSPPAGPTRGPEPKEES